MMSKKIQNSKLVINKAFKYNRKKYKVKLVFKINH